MQPVLQERGIPPTPETVHKRRYDVIANLLVRERITEDQAKAAAEIRMVLEAVGRGMFPRSGWKHRVEATPRVRTWRDYVDRMNEEERYAWEFHYLPWTRDMPRLYVVRDGVRGRPTRPGLHLVIDVVIENITLGEIEARFLLPFGHGIACRLLRIGLDGYAKRME